MGIFSISCSNSDKTGSTIDDSKGIEQYNGNSYVSTQSFTIQQSTIYLWVSVKDGQVAMDANDNNTTEPTYQGYFSVTGYGTDYSFSTDYYGEQNAVVGTLKFTDTSVTVKYTKNPGAPQEMLNKDIVCNKKQ